jgi:hypothetical protein
MSLVYSPQAAAARRAGRGRVVQWPGVLRAVIVAAVLCTSFEMSGLAAVFGDQSCSEECPGDRSGGDCAPNCQCCSCCSLPKTTEVPAAAALPVAAVGQVIWATMFRQLPSAEPRDIQHVPKPLLA